MQEKVDQLINLVQSFIEQLNGVDQKKISRQLYQACFYLRSHDLAGLDLILNSFQEKMFSDEISTRMKELTNLKYNVVQLAAEIKQDFNKNVIPVSDAEELFLNLSYNRFFDICSEVFNQEFWERSPQYRFSRVSQAFLIYSEVLNYEPFEGVLKWLLKYRPPMESEISGPLFKFIRNVIAHFPFYDKWDDVWISKKLINWKNANKSMDRFLKDYSGKPEVKYRFKENSKSGFTYVTINFPAKYDDMKIYLKNIISEEQGVKFALVMMTRVLNTQIESINDKT